VIEAFQAALLQTARIDPASLERAEKAGLATGERLDRVLVKLGYATEEMVLEAWRDVTGFPIIDRVDLSGSAMKGLDLPLSFLRAQQVLPLAVEEGILSIAIVDPADDFVPSAIAAKTGLAVRRSIISESAFAAAVQDLFPASAAGSEGAEAAGEADWSDVERLKDLASDAPVIRMVNALIDRAVEQNASDIHLGLSGSGPTTRFRIDGILSPQEPVTRSLYPAVISRLKIMAGLDIAERRLPQDGRIRTTWRGRAIDLRVATVPHVAGEGIVLRVLDRSSVPLRLEALGIGASILAGLRRALAVKEGIVLVTGPTGSGKSTTLYAALSELRSPDRNIVTVEDPVEVRIEGINQIPIVPAIGFDFAKALRAVLRQDPDVIMVGEIRDRETAQVAIQAALTGHLVLATLHTNSALAAIPRLVDMGVEPFLLASTLRGVLGQRLARKLCAHCAENQPLRQDVKGASGRLARGCAQCRDSGYLGRTALCEFVPVDESTQRLIARGADETVLIDHGRDRGWRTLLHDGREQVDAGLISEVEMLRVLGVSMEDA
jgi:type II secretory ATPase GspE/PulE/Tfp pilus assembly ATPase PilB-like protein